MEHPAQWWTPEGAGVRCLLCRHYCHIPAGAQGLCSVRECRATDGAPCLYTLVGELVISTHLDPVEKKPLYHFMPGSMTYSFGTVGCNFSCDFCQNWSISRLPADQGRIAGRNISPKQLVAEALARQADSVSFTYTEPAVFYECMAQTADLAEKAGLARILISNAYFAPRALRALERRIQAANIDLKAFSERFYRDICGARLKPVLRNLRAMAAMGWWLEITTLLVPGLNDSDAELRDLVRFIRDELGPDVPWHISRFRPEYRLRSLPPTPQADLERAWNIGREEGLRYVYIGNLPGHPAGSTYCGHCGELFARRLGFSTLLPADGHCASCGTAIPGVGWGKSMERP